MLGARLLTGTALGAASPPLDFRLATTRGTNALLEHKGADVAFFVTHGFGDLLTIRDQRRPDLFALKHDRPFLLFKQAIAVSERLDSTGEILTPLFLSPELKQSAREALSNGITIAAVALLHSYCNPAHEMALREWLLELGFTHVSISSELAPLIKILPTDWNLLFQGVLIGASVLLGFRGTGPGNWTIRFGGSGVRTGGSRQSRLRASIHLCEGWGWQNSSEF